MNHLANVELIEKMRPIFHKHSDEESRVILVSSGLATQGRLPPSSVLADVKDNYNGPITTSSTLQPKSRRYLTEGRTRKNQAELFAGETDEQRPPRGWVPLGYTDSKILQAFYASYLYMKQPIIMANDVKKFGYSTDRKEVSVVVVCPGWCQTELDRYARDEMEASFERSRRKGILHMLWAYVKKILAWVFVGWAKLSFQRTALQGAQNLIFAVLSSVDELEASARGDSDTETTADSGVFAIRDGKPEKTIATRLNKIREINEGTDVEQTVIDFSRKLLGLEDEDSKK